MLERILQFAFSFPELLFKASRSSLAGVYSVWPLEGDTQAARHPPKSCSSETPVQGGVCHVLSVPWVEPQPAVTCVGPGRWFRAGAVQIARPRPEPDFATRRQ